MIWVTKIKVGRRNGGREVNLTSGTAESYAVNGKCAENIFLSISHIFNIKQEGCVGIGGESSCANKELSILGPGALVAVVVERADFVVIVGDPPKAVVIGRIGCLALLELDDIDGVVGILFYFGVIDQLEDRGCAKILTVLHTCA